MKTLPAAVVATAFAFASSAAAAHASATATIGDTTVTQTGSGPNFGTTSWQVALDTGESVSRTFSYDVTMHTDGLPATRTWDDDTLFACLPLNEVKCGPDATGSELVEVFLQTYRDGREANPFITFTGTITEDFFLTTAGTQTHDATFTLTATNTGVGIQADGIDLLAGIWIDSSDATAAVPEPGNLSLALAGLSTALLALRRKRGR